jgi:hypothetical protein
MLFSVKGVDYAGRRFAGRFEAPSEHRLRNWMSDCEITVESIRALPLTSGPYSRFSWLILVFPVLAGVVLYTILVVMRMTALGEIPGWGPIAGIVALDAILAVPIYNILLRLGSHYEFDEGRIIQYVSGGCIVTSEDERKK